MVDHWSHSKHLHSGRTFLDWCTKKLYYEFSILILKHVWINEVLNELKMNELIRNHLFDFETVLFIIIKSLFEGEL